MQPLWDERYQPVDATIIQQKAITFARRNRFHELDVDDIRQEMALQVFQQISRHRPERGSRAGFVSKIAKNKLLNLIEKRSAKKRDDRRNIEYDDGPEGTLIDAAMTPEQTDLKIDLQDVVRRMSPDLRQIWELRVAGHSAVEMENVLGLTRGKVRALMQRLEQFLREAGLDPGAAD